LPQTLLHAVQALRGDQLLLDALGTDLPVADYFADAKEQEFLRWHNTVSDWEVRSYLTAY
jgi:glutamine synthetase